MSNDLIAYLFWLLITLIIIVKIDKSIGLGKILSFIFLIIGLLFLYGGISNLQESRYQNQNYIETSCRVAQQIPEPVTQNTKGSTDGIYCPMLILSYAVNNKPLTSKVKLRCVSKETEQTAMLAVYGVGTEIPCWYDSQNIGTASVIRPETLQQALLSKALLIGILLLSWVGYRYWHPRTIVSPTVIQPKTPPITPIKAKNTQATPTLGVNEIFNTLGKQKDQNFSFKWVKSDSPQNKTTLPKLILGLLVTGLMCTAIIFLVIIPDWRANYSYQPTTCTILETQMNRSTSDNKVIYKPLLHVNYVINGSTYSSWAQISYNYSEQENQARAALNAYQVNYSYPCQYDPKNYSNVIMVKGHMNYWGIFALAFCILFGSLIIYGFIQDRRNDLEDENK